MTVRPVILIVVILCFQRCAQVGMLSGGKPDRAPPVLKEALPPSGSLNFKQGEVVLKFNEFVQLKDINNQLIVSPRLKTFPEVIAEGRNVKIKFNPDELRPNTTYRFFFGQAIADMNESNSINDFVYVFSTGGTIDTVELKGVVTEATSNAGAAGAIIGLYPPGNDSLPFKEPADYYVRSKENGAFKFSNLPLTSFKVVAISDKNKNELYDGETEKIAFVDEPVTLLGDTAVRLRLFEEEPPRTYIKRTVSPYFGLAQVILNKKSLVRVSTLHDDDRPNLYESSPGKEKDTVSVYYKEIKDTLNLVVENLSSQKTDTLRVLLPPNHFAKRKLRSYQVNAAKGPLPLGNRLNLSFYTWMDTTRLNADRIKLYLRDDTTAPPLKVTGRWQNITTFEATNVLAEGKNYVLKLDTGAFYDLKGYTNDSSQTNFRTQAHADLGKLILKVRFDKKRRYVVQLVTDQQRVMGERWLDLSASAGNLATLDFTDVVPGNYVTRIIVDDNGNKKWDTGNLMKRKQPEQIMIGTKLIKVIPDWEVEEEISISDP